MDRREAIKALLRQARWLTFKQLAQLLPESQDGRVLKPHLIVKRNKTYEMPPTYTRTKEMVWNMVRDGELEEPTRDHNQQPYLISLKGVQTPDNFYIRKHEETCGDLFVACYLRLGSALEYWDTRWPEDDKQDYRIKQFGVNYDCRMHYKGNVYFWEVDMGTKPYKDEEEKIDKYISFSKSFPADRFTVLYATRGYRKTSETARANGLTNILSEKKRGNQFLIGLQSMVFTDPLAECFVSPLDGTKFMSIRPSNEGV